MAAPRVISLRAAGALVRLAVIFLTSGLPGMLAAPVFDLGACGLFTDISSGIWGPMLYVAKVALEEGFLDDQLANNDFSITVNMIETGCTAKGVSQRMLPALLGEGQTAGRIYSANTTTDPVLAIVGCMCSAVSVTVSQISAPLYVPMVSMSSTAPSLSDKDQHPYFARVVPPDSMSGAGLVGLVQYFSKRAPHGEWSRVSLIYSRTVYGEGVANVFANDDQLSNFTVLTEAFVSIETTIGTTESEYASVAEAAGRVAAESPALRVFVFPADLASAPIVLRAFAEAGLFNENCVGLATEGVTAALFTSIDTLAAGREVFLAGDYDSLSDEEVSFYSSSVGNYDWSKLQEVLLGWISIKPDGQGSRVKGTAFAEFWSGLTREKLLAVGMPSILETPDSWFQDTDVVLDDQWGVFVFDAATNIIVAIGDLLASGVASEDVKGEVLRDAIFASQFEGLTGTIELNSQGDRLGSYRINNIRSLRSLEDIGEYNGVTDTIAFDVDPIFPSGTTEVPRDRPEPCPIGAERQGDSCEACPAGKYNPTEDSSCLDCFEGTYTAEAGSASCSTAPAGSFVATTGSTAASLCEAGTISSTIGASECLFCQQGYYTEFQGQTECNYCPQGTYTDVSASASCSSCLDGETTATVASKNETECVCDEGSYRPASSGRVCTACPTGMTCAVGSDMHNWAAGSGEYPLSAKGYMSLSSDPLLVYRCLLDAHCPGGTPGTCASHRDPTTIACGECGADAYPDSEECKACSDDAIYLFVGAIVLAILAAIAFSTLVGRDSLSQTNNTVACAVGLGLLLTGIQSLGVYDQLSITWMDPIKGLVSIADIFSFNMNVLKTNCLFGSDPLLHYLGRLLIFPILLPFIGFVSWKNLAPTDQLVPTFINNAGALFSICFISVVVTCVLPLVCYSHPDGTLKSMRASPSTLCYEGHEHILMAFFGIFTFFVLPIPFVAVTLYGAWAYPTLVQQVSSRGRLQALRFLYIKFTPECYFYAPFPLLRNLMVSLVPVVMNKAAAQITSLCAVFSMFTLLQVRLWPWRGSFVNVVDSMVSTLLQLTLITGALVTGASQLDGAVKTVNVAVVVCFILVFISVIGFVIYNLGMRNRNKYDNFVCHHKAGAAAQARLLKIKLTGRGQSVFIDSDDLSDLDDLFDIVKCKVRQLCVLLTRDTLRRPWCAGEITTAFNTSNVKVLRIQMPCFLRPTEEQLEDTGSYVDETGCFLRQYGMTYEAVTEAFTSLLSSETPAILVRKPPASLKHHDHLVNAVVKGSDACLFSEKNILPELTDSSGQVLVSAERNSEEAVAAAWILHSKLQEKLFQRDGQRAEFTCLFEYSEDDFPTLMQCIESAKAVIILLSPNSLNTWGQVSVICQSMEVRQLNESLVVHPMMLPGFVFPTDLYYEDVLPKLMPTYFHEFEPILRSVFKLIVTPLSTHASDSTLELEVSKVVERLPGSVTAVFSEHSGQTRGSRSMKTTVTQRMGNLKSSIVDVEVTTHIDDWDDTKSQDIHETYSC